MTNVHRLKPSEITDTDLEVVSHILPFLDQALRKSIEMKLPIGLVIRALCIATGSGLAQIHPTPGRQSRRQIAECLAVIKGSYRAATQQIDRVNEPR